MKRNTILSAILATFMAAVFAIPVGAQTTVNTTTLSSALSAPIGVGSNGSITATGPNNVFQVGSTSNIVAGYELFVDQEAMLVISVPVSGTVQVQRGYDQTSVASHASGATVYIGSVSGTIGSPFQAVDPPIGTCSLSNEQFSLRINVKDGNIWQCTNGQWMNVVDSYAWVGPGNCWYSTSGGTLTAPTFGAAPGNTQLGLQGAAAPSGTSPATPVMQVATTNAGTAIDIVSCLVPIPSRTNGSKGVYLVDATWFYGVQQTGLGTQAATLASGTINGFLAFGTLTLPAAGNSETPSTATMARWDSGTMVLTPTAANMNVATTSAGAFVSEKVAPANPIAMSSDLTNYYVNLALQCTATSATTVQVPGVLIHYRTVTGL